MSISYISSNSLCLTRKIDRPDAMDTNTTRDAANPMITAYRGRLQYRKPLPPPPPSRGSSTRSTLTAVSAGDEEEEAERIRRKPAPVYMDHGLIPVYDVDTEGTYPGT